MPGGFKHPLLIAIGMIIIEVAHRSRLSSDDEHL
jgi:hypothetical protein